jgi:hypothetical protein
MQSQLSAKVGRQSIEALIHGQSVADAGDANKPRAGRLSQSQQQVLDVDHVTVGDVDPVHQAGKRRGD